MSEILLYQHTGSGNHGCEALVRTAVNLLKAHGKITLCSARPWEDRQYGVDKLELQIVQSFPLKRYSLRWCLYQANRRILKNCKLGENAFYDKAVVNEAKKCKVALAIGGDNYCYDQGRSFWSTDIQVKKHVEKLVLWGASLEPDEIYGEFAEHLRIFDLIIARESITYLRLKELDFPAVLYPDSAFTLGKEVPKREQSEKERKRVGINVSPLALAKGDAEGSILNGFVDLIKYILKNTEYDIQLIPHVVWKESDDRQVLLKIKKEFENEERVVLIEDQNCCQLKSVISKCDLFVGARTHATIAAYSTGIPTLVIGYSVKARGIAKDLFGKWENYVLPVQNIKSSVQIVEAFKILEKGADFFRTRLKEVLPEYIENASSAGDEISRWLKDNE